MKGLNGIMLNIGGSRESASLWAEYARISKYWMELEIGKQQANLGTVCAYRIASAVALQVVASIIPIHIMAGERSHRQGENSEGSRNVKREGTLPRWQEEWDAEEEKAQWT